MIGVVTYRVNRASESEIETHLVACDDCFVPRLSERVDIASYANKISINATRFEAWSNGRLIGLLAMYCDSPHRGIAFITNVSLLPYWRGRGIASMLLQDSIRHVDKLGYVQIDLEVDLRNTNALRLYAKHGFRLLETQSDVLRLELKSNLV